MENKNSFHIAIESTKDIATGYRVGLQALGSNASKIAPTSTKMLEGSVDIDSLTARIYHDANRWDYAIGYNNKVYFAEVHPAYTSEVMRVIQKMKWLKEWLQQKAPMLNVLPKGIPTFSWIQSGKGGILPGSKQAKLAAANGLKPIKQLILK